MNAYRIGGFAAVLATIAPGAANAEPRRFYCGEESFVSLEAPGDGTISAGPIDGRSIILGQVAGTNRYAFGDTTIDLAPDGKSLQIIQPGRDAIGCVFPVPAEITTPGAASAGTQAQGAPDAKPGAAAVASGKATRDEAETPASFPARSWGGVVRDGPGMEYRKLASLAEGAAITVEQSTGVEMNGYLWFQIRFGDNRTGFQWGGIICPIGKEIPGTFETCK